MEGSCLHRFHVLLVFWFLCMRILTTSSSSSNVTELSVIKCIKEEKEALLKIKHGLVDGANWLSSWDKEEDCCNWRGVSCNIKNGHVYGLSFRPAINFTPAGFSFIPFEGEISSSITELRYLTFLDLSFFKGSGNSIPHFIGSLKNLRYLNFSSCSFSWKIPDQFGNLTRLVSLDLSYNSFHKVESLMFLSHFIALKHFDMSSNNLSQAIDWFQAINMLPSLLNLHLRECHLSLPIPPSLYLHNSSKFLAVIDFEYNSLTSSIFPWLLNFNNTLVSLDLRENLLQDPIPDAFGAMIALKHLDLSYNGIEGEIPRSLGNLYSLETLDLSRNNLTGNFPDMANVSFIRELYLSMNKVNCSPSDSIGQLSNLEVLDLSSNSMSGVISEIHLAGLSKLWKLDISNNSYTLTLSPNWNPPFQLIISKMRSCILGPHFPQWLHTQKRIIHLDISNTRISDRISDRFWELPPTLRYLNLSYNLISGEVQKLPLILSNFSFIDMSSNSFHGSLPLFRPDITLLNLAKNKLSGTISTLCSISGKSFTFLDLSDNSFSGELPNCWMHWKKLVVMNLANNNFSGSIQASFELLSVSTLQLRNNSFSGGLPPALGNCKDLRLLDLGENRFSSRIPGWLGDLPKLVVLRLRSNHFHGSIPLQLCHLAYIQILDFSRNNISGSIPQCLNSLTTLAKQGGTDENSAYAYFSYPFDLDLVQSGSFKLVGYTINIPLAWKGIELEYGKTLGLVKCIDFSSNNLSGNIPDEIATLAGLISLNLSHNQLAGVLPLRIGHLYSLESLDLSANDLSGRLPEGLAHLNFLSSLNLSDNKFVGKIPTSTQLQSFDNTSFKGNAGLCGKPLPNRCPGEQPDHPTIDGGRKNVVMEDGKDEIITSGFYISMGVGFATAFWAVCGALLLYRPGRHAYFRFLDMVGRWLYVRAVIRVAKLRGVL